MSSEYGGNGDSASDVFDRHRWQDVELDINSFGGESPTYPGMREHVCPLIAANITADGGPELEKCGRCGIRKSRRCDGFNGKAPCPMKGTKIIFR